jgi:hypothetical protein
LFSISLWNWRAQKPPTSWKTADTIHIVSDDVTVER